MKTRPKEKTSARWTFIENPCQSRMGHYQCLLAKGHQEEHESHTGINKINWPNSENDQKCPHKCALSAGHRGKHIQETKP